MTEQIMVSVVCLAYNQQDFIRDTLQSFVEQKAAFRFEVVVHDDASSDGTADIIREYEQKYPSIIKGIYQRENQLSQKKWISRDIVFPHCSGRYLAWCEGDDKWTDPYKLQKQFDYMETHPECAMCYHRTTKHWCTPGGEDSIEPEQSASRDYSLSEIASRRYCFALASAFIRSDLYRNIPECFFARTCGDIPLQIYASICGKVHCLQDVMAVYNYRRAGAFTKEFFADHSKKIDHNRDIINMLRNTDEYYQFQYTEELTEAIRYHEYHLYKHTGETEKISGPEYDRVREWDRQRIAGLKKLEKS